MKTIEIIKQVFGTISPLKTLLKDLCISYITEALKADIDGSIEFYDDDGEPIVNEFCVTYDGGRHPEYNSNPYSDVYSVYLSVDDKVMLRTEDSDEVKLEGLDALEIYDVACAVDGVLTPQK